MAANKVLHMNSGDGETSYANNSGIQKFVISKSLDILDETIEDMLSNDHTIEFTKCFKMVDLGCASGPNTLLTVTHIMNKIGDSFRQKNINNNDELPEFEVFLNDLPDNDFNNLFKSLPKERENWFVYGLPGSFYGRLLPKQSIHFAYSSYSIHWLSQLPEGLENKNKENIYMAMTSSPEVYEAYANQYKRDIHTFLSSRAAEIIPGGRMVLVFSARSVEDPSTNDDDFIVFTVLAKTLAEMVPEGLVKMDDLYSFNMPIYGPCKQEVETAIESEGSFTLDKLDTFTVSMGNKSEVVDDDDDTHDPFIKRGKIVADYIRGVMEPMLASHFGSSIIDDLFVRYTKKLAEFATDQDGGSFNIVISLTRK